MENKFEQAMVDRTNQQLIKIITVDKESYQKLAVQAARLEIEKRNLSADFIDKTEKEVISEYSVLNRVNSQKASILKRMLNFIIDTGIIIVLMYFFYVTLSELPRLFTKFIILIYFGYYIYFEHKFQKTIGKYITKTKLVNIDGEKATMTQIVQRTFSRLLPFDPFTFFFPKRDMEFHDVFTNTKVINDKKTSQE
jgi:uncharacterized RDD family membrane protein YckC